MPALSKAAVYYESAQSQQTAAALHRIKGARRLFARMQQVHGVL